MRWPGLRRPWSSNTPHGSRHVGYYAIRTTLYGDPPPREKGVERWVVLAESYYPRARDLAVSICATLGVSVPEEALTALDSKGPIDVPDSSFTGPF